MSSASRRKTTVGEIVNLMSIDAQKMHDVCNSLHEVWACPILIVIAMVLLWRVIGPSSLAGLGLLLVMAPINGGALGRLYMKSQVSVVYMAYIISLSSPVKGCRRLTGKFYICTESLFLSLSFSLSLSLSPLSISCFV